MKKLSNIELACYKQGKLIISDEQLAVCYLVAKYNVNGQIPKFKFQFEHNLGIECGMNEETYRRTTKKFQLIFEGKDEDTDETDKEHIYPKLKNAFYEFGEMKEDAIFKIAETAFTEDNQKIGLAIHADKMANADQYNLEYKKKDLIIKRIK